jgi:hypothetical protein
LFPGEGKKIEVKTGPGCDRIPIDLTLFTDDSVFAVSAAELRWQYIDAKHAYEWARGEHGSPKADPVKYDQERRDYEQARRQYVGCPGCAAALRESATGAPQMAADARHGAAEARGCCAKLTVAAVPGLVPGIRERSSRPGAVTR